MRISYRIGQLWQAVAARPLPARAWQEIGETLTPPEQALFRRYSLNDQRHTHRVWQTLRRSGNDDEHLLVAALLHDAGKTRLGLTIVERIMVVLANAFAPRLAKRWGEGAPAGWRRPFVVWRQHPEWGAEMAAKAGSHPIAVLLISHHQDDLARCPPDLEPGVLELLERLQWADGRN